jgi:hypothetical protein
MDSGFEESHLKKETKARPLPVQRSNTAPTRPHKRPQINSEPIPKDEPTGAGNRRSSSEKRSGSRRGPEGQRRKSLASSSENSSKSRRHGNGSKPSSRRTSYTLVDPSRPRHCRIKSSPTVPSAHGEIDDVLALHFRSCSLFQTNTYQCSLPSPTISEHRPADTGLWSTQFHAAPAAASHVYSDDIIDDKVLAPEQEPLGTDAEVCIPNTTMHWTSPSTRRLEYEKMDRAHSGIRGLVRKVLPSWVLGPPPPRFYEEDKSDCGSVRRYRMDLSEDDDGEVDEKNATPKVDPVRSKSLDCTSRQTDLRKRWGCF